MRFKWLNDYWLGALLLATVTTVSLWLASQGRLVLYIHPRYIVFTVVLCALAGICIIADLAVRKKLPPLTGRSAFSTVLLSILCIAVCVTLIVLRPSGLTSSTAKQRVINSAALSIGAQTSPTDLSSVQADYDKFTLKEWASLLAQTTDAQLFKDKPASISGFVAPTGDNNPNVFYLSRFVITCCAVDARPIGVPIYKPNWRNTYRENQWLDIHGVFDQSPVGGANPVTLIPQSVKPINEPARPYAY